MEKILWVFSAKTLGEGMDERVMCGIVGIASQPLVYERGWLVAERNNLRHQGLDDVVERRSADGRLDSGSDETGIGFCIAKRI